MTDWPIALKILTGIYMVLGMAWLFLTMFVLHAYETKTKSLPPFITFWPFYKEVREEYPDATRWGRSIMVLGLALAPIWLAYQ